MQSAPPSTPAFRICANPTAVTRPPPPAASLPHPASSTVSPAKTAASTPCPSGTHVPEGQGVEAAVESMQHTQSGLRMTHSTLSGIPSFSKPWQHGFETEHAPEGSAPLGEERYMRHCPSRKDINPTRRKTYYIKKQILAMQRY